MSSAAESSAGGGGCSRPTVGESQASADRMVSTAGIERPTNAGWSAAPATPLKSLNWQECETFERVFRSHYQVVQTFLLHRIQRPEEVEDLVQATFAYVWAHIHEVPERNGSLHVWLFRVASRQVSNHFRSNARRRNLVDRIKVNQRSESYVNDLASERLLDAIDTLPAPTREVLHLAYWYGSRHDEAALMLGCSVNAFDIRLLRARRELARALGASK